MKKLVILALPLLMWGDHVLANSNCTTASITASTPTTDFVDHVDGTVTHTKTELMWRRCSEGLSGAVCGLGTLTTHTWQEALQQVEALNSGGGFAGYTDWRLPNIKELASIVEEQCANPAINATIFPTTASSGYWSSSPYAGSASSAWNVFFSNGNDSPLNKSNVLYVRLVRGGQ